MLHDYLKMLLPANGRNQGAGGRDGLACCGSDSCISYNFCQCFNIGVNDVFGIQNGEAFTLRYPDRIILGQISSPDQANYLVVDDPRFFP